jgi:hypothetical protein
MLRTRTSHSTPVIHCHDITAAAVQMFLMTDPTATAGRGEKNERGRNAGRERCNLGRTRVEDADSDPSESTFLVIWTRRGAVREALECTRPATRGGDSERLARVAPNGRIESH